ncbi:MAG: hypothetical protein M1839_007513 [Geoglossum umbratile]|nr:MAG: hypothetical protein M1839_007513 [Geoglossum umbratile]
MGRVQRQTRRVKEKNPHLDAEYYEQLYADKELVPSQFRISPSTERGESDLGDLEEVRTVHFECLIQILFSAFARSV